MWFAQLAAEDKVNFLKAHSTPYERALYAAVASRNPVAARLAIDVITANNQTCLFSFENKLPSLRKSAAQAALEKDMLEVYEVLMHHAPRPTESYTFLMGAIFGKLLTEEV